MLMLLRSVHQSRLPHIIVWFPRPDVKMFYKEPFLPTNTSYSAKPTQIHIFFSINLRTSKRTETAGLCHGPGTLLLASHHRDLGSMPWQSIWDTWQEKWYWGRTFKCLGLQHQGTKCHSLVSLNAMHATCYESNPWYVKYFRKWTSSNTSKLYAVTWWYHC